MTDNASLRRISQTTLGTFGLLIKDGQELCVTCERPWLDNEPNVSCIPAGRYRFTRYESPTKGRVWITQDVPGRSNIELHSANFPSQLAGCVAVGNGFLRDAGSNISGVADSRNTLGKLYNELPDEFDLVVEDVPTTIET